MNELLLDIGLSEQIDNEILLQDLAEPVEIECLTLEEWLAL